LSPSLVALLLCLLPPGEVALRTGHWERMRERGRAGNDDQERAHLVELPDATACSGAAAVFGSRRGSDQQPNV
ncbi:MAG: hypothetical protein ACPIOQ_29800, partial [Promethearchaeia archaeon]